MKFEKKLLSVFATSTASYVIFSLFIEIMFSLDLFLSVRKVLAVRQNFLLSVIAFSFRFGKYSLFFPIFSEVIKQNFFYLG